MKIQILIPYLLKEFDYKIRVEGKLNQQISKLGLDKEIEILWNPDQGEKTIGEKRNELLQMVTAEYCAFFDVDDLPGDDYINTIYKGAVYGADVVSLLGEITWDGKNPELFEHSIRYSKYWTNPDKSAKIKYQRFPNHLNCIKSEIAKNFYFPLKNHGEDTDWATLINEAGVLKKEYYTNKIIYHYLYRTKK